MQRSMPGLPGIEKAEMLCIHEKRGLGSHKRLPESAAKRCAFFERGMREKELSRFAALFTLEFFRGCIGMRAV
jgi:hypothetical protein